MEQLPEPQQRTFYFGNNGDQPFRVRKENVKTFSAEEAAALLDDDFESVNENRWDDCGNYYEQP